MFLLDINVLIALCDADHAFREAAKRWFLARASAGWATCPLTQNGVLRIMGHPGYPGGPGSPEAVRPLLAAWTALPGHHFWPDDVSLLDADLFPALGAISARDVTDLYLLGLAARRGGRFCTFDSKLDPSWVPRAASALERIPTD